MRNVNGQKWNNEETAYYGFILTMRNVNVNEEESDEEFFAVLS